MSSKVFALIAMSAFIFASPLTAQDNWEVVKQVQKINVESQPNLITTNAEWKPWEQGFEKQGDLIVCDNGTDSSNIRGAGTIVVLNQTIPASIRATAKAKGEKVSGNPDSNYSLYLDITYQDGTPQWGVIDVFPTGTHDWREAVVDFIPEKPIKHVNVYVLLRNHAGKASFKDITLRESKEGANIKKFDGSPLKSWKPYKGFHIRNFGEDSDFYGFGGQAPYGVQLKTTENTDQDGVRRIEADFLATDTSKDLCLQIAYSLPLEGTGWQWLEHTRQREATEGRYEFTETSVTNYGGTGRLSYWPFGAVAKDGRGRALAIDMFTPAHHRCGFNSALNELYIVFDVALTKEQPKATLKLAQFDFDASWGFRSAYAALVKAFPAAFVNRIENQGNWMAFAPISKVEGWEDFGFAIKEGVDEPKWDDDHGILTFRYTEPLTWWMNMDPTKPREYEDALAKARELEAKGNKHAMALFTSGHKTLDGKFSSRISNTPWSTGAVWSMNSMPGIPGEVTDFKNKWNEDRKSTYTRTDINYKLDGEYIDSSEGYVTQTIDYDRTRFQYAKAPICFDRQANPGIFTGLIAYEYVRQISEDVHALGKLMMANSTPSRLWFLAPWLEVMGSEMNWNYNAKWRPPSDTVLFYRRAICGPKPYCILQNSNFDDFGLEQSELYMKRSLFYGFYPSYFSADASTKHYFRNPALYNRDRHLFKKYVPLCKLAGEAGWEPITLAHSSNPQAIWLERFGEKYYTVFNGSDEAASATISFDKPIAKLLDRVSGKEYTVSGKSISVTLNSEDVMLLEAIQ